MLSRVETTVNLLPRRPSLVKLENSIDSFRVKFHPFVHRRREKEEEEEEEEEDAAGWAERSREIPRNVIFFEDEIPLFA